MTIEATDRVESQFLISSLFYFLTISVRSDVSMIQSFKRLKLGYLNQKLREYIWNVCM